MKVSYEYDQDPRYGWASVSLDGATTGLIVVHTERGSFGFNFVERDGTMRPTCLCSAWNEGECTCPGVDWSNQDEEPKMVGELMPKRYVTTPATWPIIETIEKAIAAADAGDAPCLATAIYLSLILDGCEIALKESQASG